MATVHIKPWEWWFSGQNGRMPEIRTSVYYKTQWADEWTYAPHWEPVTAVKPAAPATGSATFLLRYGKGWWEDSSAMVNDIPSSFAYCYVQIRSAVIRGLYRGEEVIKPEDIEEVTLWTGVIPAQSFRILGQRVRSGEVIKTSNQMLRAHSLDWLLETRLDGAWVEPVGGGDPNPKWIGWLPAFNKRYEHGGNIMGNRSTWNESKDSYIFADAGNVWSNYSIIWYLLSQYQENNGPFFDLGGTVEILEALDKMSGVYDFKSMTLRAALNVLMNRSRGLSWKFTVDSDGKVEVVPLSLLDEKISFGDVTMPANKKRVFVDMWGDPATTTVNITDDISHTFDEIIVRGAKMKSACSLRYIDSLLEKGWTAAEETAYKDAAKNTDGYGSLNDDEKAKLNDKFRSVDRFERVFTTVRAPRDWNWLATDIIEGEADVTETHIVNPKLNSAGEIGDLLDYLRNPIPANQAVYYNVGKRFLNFLPFRVGVDYSGSSPSDKNPTDAEPEFRKMFVLVKDTDSKYQYAEKLMVEDENEAPKLSGASVRPLTREMGIEMRFRPPYMAAKDNWSSAEPGVYTDRIADEGIDYTKIIATVFIETDQYVQMSHEFGIYENQRIKTIDIPNAELWYVTPDTIIDIDDEGDCVLYGGSASILRDDRDRLRAALTAAIAWYGKRRNKMEIIVKNIDPGISRGTMIEGGDVAGVGAAATAVTSISWNFGRKPTTTIRTDFGELDIAAIFSSGRAGGGR